MKKLFLITFFIFLSVVSNSYSGDYTFWTFQNGVTGEVSGSLDNLDCTTLGSKDGWGIVHDSGDLSYWTYDWNGTTAEDATHVHCKSGAWTQGVWTKFTPTGASSNMVSQSDCLTITEGICLDTDDGKLYAWDGDSVELIGPSSSSILVSQSNCLTITEGLCLDTDDGKLYSWDGDSVELVGVLDFLSLANGGVVLEPIILDGEGGTDSPYLRFIDNSDEYFNIYKADGIGIYMATDTADTRTITMNNGGAGVMNLAVEGTIYESGTTLSGKYQPLENQRASTTDSPSFVAVTVTGTASANGGFEIDNQPNSNQTCQGILTTVVAGQDSITFGMALTVDNSTGKYIAANANSAGVLPCRAIACQTADTDDPIEVMTLGWIRDDSWDFTDDINKDIVLDETAGAWVLADGSIPADTGDIIQKIGYVTLTGATEIFYFNPQQVYVILN